MKKILSMILLMALLTAGCAFAEVLEMHGAMLVSIDIPQIPSKVWMQDSESRALLSVLVLNEMKDRISEYYGTNLTFDESCIGRVGDDFIIGYCGGERDLVMIFIPSENEFDFCDWEDGDIEETVQEISEWYLGRPCDELYLNDPEDIERARNGEIAAPQFDPEDASMNDSQPGQEVITVESMQESEETRAYFTISWIFDLLNQGMEEPADFAANAVAYGETYVGFSGAGFFCVFSYEDSSLVCWCDADLSNPESVYAESMDMGEALELIPEEMMQEEMIICMNDPYTLNAVLENWTITES